MAIGPMKETFHAVNIAHADNLIQTVTNIAGHNGRPVGVRSADGTNISKVFNHSWRTQADRTWGLRVLNPFDAEGSKFRKI